MLKMPDDYLNVPFTIVKEFQDDPQSSDKQYKWIYTDNENSCDNLSIEVTGISLRQFPRETLNMQVNILEAEVDGCADSGVIYMNNADNSINEREVHCYSYQLKLEFENYLHEFNQNYCYEVMCKTAKKNEQESEYLFCCMEYRRKKSISFEEKFLIANMDLTDYSRPKLLFFVRRLNNDTKTVIDDEKIHEVISTFRNTGYDVVLDAKDGRLSAHRSILSQNSDVFQAMFSVDMKESQHGIVNILEFEVRVVKKMLDYLYTRELGELGDMTESLFKLAHRYQLHDLCRRCEEYYIFNVKVDNDSIVEILKIADVYELKKLSECATNFANRHEKELITLASYREYLIQSVNLENAVTRLLLADKYSAADVKLKIFDFIKDSYAKMIEKSDFLGLFESQGRLMREMHVHLYT